MELPDLPSFKLSSIEEAVFRFKYPIIILLAGLLLVGGGLFLWRAGVFEGTKVEVMESVSDSDGDSNKGNVVVEISGAVEKPGVYELLASDRVERLLIASGGLSIEADRSWVEKNLNRAAKLIDGQKIYVPKAGETTVYGLQSTVGKNSAVVGSQSTVVNLNTATASELDSLWGIGPARAEAIIDGRPYSSVEELLSKKIIPSNVYERIKEQVTAP